MFALICLKSLRDTTALRNLLNKRTEVLEKLEVAETKYIRSFKANFPQPEKPAVSQVEDNGNLQVVREAVDRSMGIVSVSIIPSVSRLTRQFSFRQDSGEDFRRATSRRGQDRRKTQLRRHRDIFCLEIITR